MPETFVTTILPNQTPIITEDSSSRFLSDPSKREQIDIKASCFNEIITTYQFIVLLNIRLLVYQFNITKFFLFLLFCLFRFLS